MTRAGAAGLRLAMPPAADAAPGPCTPLPYELALGIPRSLPLTTETLTPDVSGLALLTPSPDDSASRDDWTHDEVEVLETILARPPDALHFPPGAMPTPEVLDELARLVLRSFARGTNPRTCSTSRPAPAAPARLQERPAVAHTRPPAAKSRQTRRSRTSASPSPAATSSSMDADESAAGSTDTESIGSCAELPTVPAIATTQNTAPLPSPATSNSSASTVDNDPAVAPCDVAEAVRTFSVKSWHHSFTETRAKLATLVLADTRLGAEVAERKLTRKERLARPGVKRVSSMDFLDDEDSDTPSEKTGRVLRLSTTLQNSAKEPPVGLARTASLGPPAGTPQLGVGVETPPLSPGASFTLSPMTAEPSSTLGLGLGLGPRSLSRSSSRSDRGSSRPSLLQRGRSFTASDLEAELEAQAVPTIAGDSNSPRTPTISSFGGIVTVSSPSPAHSPAKRRASAPDTAVPRLLRSHSYEPKTGRRDERPRRGEAMESLAPPAAAFDHLGLGAAFEPAAATSAVGGNSSSSWDSDSDRDTHVVIKRPRQTRKGRLGALAMTALPVGDGQGKGALRSPFEEKPNAMDLGQ